MLSVFWQHFFCLVEVVIVICAERTSRTALRQRSFFFFVKIFCAKLFIFLIPKNKLLDLESLKNILTFLKNLFQSQFECNGILPNNMCTNHFF